MSDKELADNIGSDNQSQNNQEKPWLWKKGQSGNPRGRPKGITMKDYVREYLSKLSDEERDEFLDGIPKEVVWKMAEGNPETKVDAKIETSTQQFTKEELEQAKEIITKRLNDKQSRTTAPESSI